jgi:hypothetical protein
MYKNGKKMSDFGAEMAEIEHFWRSSRFFFGHFYNQNVWDRVCLVEIRGK